MIDSATQPETVSVPLYSSAAAASSAPADAPSDTPSAQSAPHLMSIKETVLNCRAAWKRAYDEEKAKGKNEYEARKRASDAYRNSMPLLTSEGNIRAFIACAAHAILVGVVPSEDGPRLIAAARLALAALPREPRSPGRPCSAKMKSCQQN